MNDSHIHVDHRQRVKERFRERGLDSFSDHEVLELLLFFGIPYKNTNETAHMLINRFRSLSGVFDADYDELLRQDGVGENTATLISLIPQLVRRYTIDKAVHSTLFDSVNKIGEYLVDHFIGATREHVELLLFDTKMRMLDHVTVHEGAVSSSDINPERIAEIIFSHRAANYVIAHNHPLGSTEPSDEDLRVTREIYRAFLPFNKYMVDHIIVSGKQYAGILQRALSMYDS